MSIFVDASALVAIGRGEPDADALLTKLEAERVRLTSSLALWETMRALAKSSKSGLDAARVDAERLLVTLDLALAPIGAAEAAEAMRTHARYGKGQHPARLNMGDCFAYACAVTNNARLLYKGDDFAQTDLR